MCCSPGQRLGKSDLLLLLVIFPSDVFMLLLDPPIPTT
jgi:hypothetical protein